MFKRVYIVALSLLFVSLSVSGQTDDKRPTVTATISEDTILIGDRFFIDITAKKDMAQVVEFPVFDNGKLNEIMEIIDESKIDTMIEGREVTLKRRYTLTAFDAGYYGIGKFPMLYADKNILDTIFSADSLKLFIKTFDIDTLTQKIVTVKPPLETPITFAEIKNILFISLAVLIVIAIIIYFVIRYRRAKKAKLDAIPDEPYHVTAIRLLESTYNQKLCQSGKYKLYYTSITDIVREYIEKRWAINAMEMTTIEIINALTLLNLSARDIAKLKELLETSDLVKFAKMVPDDTDNENSYQNAYIFIDETKPLPRSEDENNKEE